MNSTTVEAVISRALVWDNHGCMPLRADDAFLGQLERYRQSGHDVVSLNVGYDIKTVEEDFRVLAHFRHWVKRHPDRFVLVETVDDVILAKRTGKLAVSFDHRSVDGQQGSEFLADVAAVLRDPGLALL